MAALTVSNISRSGVSLAGASAAGGGDTFVNTGKEMLIIYNGDASPITLTISTPATVDGLAVAERTVAVGATTRLIIGPFPPGTYNDTLVTGGIVSLSYSAVTSVTVAVIKFVD